MIINCITYSFENGNRDKFCHSIHQDHILDDIRANPGLIQWDYFLPENDDGTTLYLLERWEGQSAIDHHLTLDAHKKYQAIKQENGCTSKVLTVIPLPEQFS